jgi:hypothetical protein
MSDNIPNNAIPITPTDDMKAKAEEISIWVQKFIDGNPLPAFIDKLQVVAYMSNGIVIVMDAYTLSAMNIKGGVS